MKLGHPERRNAIRYPIEAKVLVHKSQGQSVPAMAGDISGAGMLLHLEQSSGFTPDEVVTVEIELPDHPDKPLSSWGIASVVRIVGNDVALRVCAGTFAA
jgi:hypothetical protein